jgi:hypothetical protein
VRPRRAAHLPLALPSEVAELEKLAAADVQVRGDRREGFWGEVPPERRGLIEEALGEIETRGIEAQLRKLVGPAQQRDPTIACCGGGAGCAPLLGQTEHAARRHVEGSAGAEWGAPGFDLRGRGADRAVTLHGVEIEQHVQESVHCQALALRANVGSFIEGVEPGTQEPLRRLEVGRVRRFAALFPIDVVRDPPGGQQRPGVAAGALKDAATTGGGAGTLASGHGVHPRGDRSVRASAPPSQAQSVACRAM